MPVQALVKLLRSSAKLVPQSAARSEAIVSFLQPALLDGFLTAVSPAKTAMFTACAKTASLEANAFAAHAASATLAFSLS